MKKYIHKMSPAQFLVSSLLALILIGTILLALPISRNEDVSLIDLMFTVTSCLTVTGLSTVDPGTTFTIFGQVVMMFLIQIGGLGIMSLAVLIFIMLGKKVSLKNRLLLQSSLNQNYVGGIILLWRRLFIFAIGIEIIAALLLAIKWVPEFGIEKGLYYSLFHSISAFNNAGFTLFPDNLEGYVSSPLINIVITSLFILGGLGFTVLIDIWKKKSFKKLSLHSKLMIWGTVIINSIGTITIFLLEYSNPNTIGNLSSGTKVMASYFQSVTLRTAGFNTIDISSLSNSTLLLMLVFMFIGAGSASTGGGIKLTTFLVIIFSVSRFLTGKKDIVITKRKIKMENIFKALAVTTISVFFIFFAVFLLTITEDQSVISLLFEVISAFGTVGLTMGVTPTLSIAGKCIIIFMMYFGKVGPLTLAFSLARQDKSKISYPTEEIMVG